MAVAESSVMDYVQSFQEGSERAFNYLFSEHYSALCLFASRIIHRMDIAEELAGDALFKLWERRRGFSHPMAIRSFLYKAVRFACLNYIRDHQRDLYRSRDLAYVAEFAEAGMLQTLISRESGDEVVLAVSRLPGQCRAVVHSLFVGGKTPEQVAVQMGLTVSTIRNQKARGMRLLRQRMDLASCF